MFEVEGFDPKELGYPLTVKEIDRNVRYGVLELAGMSGLGIEKVKALMESGVVDVEDGKVLGESFLGWVRGSGVGVKGE